ncbi:MAG: TonB-dependent receptor, partial [Bacteroidota bacterium]
YGGRLASVIDVRMKEGNRKRWAGSGGIGLLASRLTLEGPLDKAGKGSILLSGRRTYFDLLLGLVDGPAEKRILNFHDASVKLNYELGDKDRIYVSAYTGRDNFGSEFDFSGEGTTRDAFNWGNRTLTARWNRQLGNRAFLNVTAIGADFDFEVENEEIVRDTLYALRYRSKIDNVGLSADVDWFLSPQHSVRMGGGALRHNFDLGTLARQQAEEPFQQADQAVTATEYHVYLEDEFTPSPRLRINAGLRATLFQPTDGTETFSSLEPRLNVSYRPGVATTFKAAAGFARQYLHLLSNSGPGLPTSLWVPATERTPPQSGWQFALGAAYQPTDSKWSSSLEFYYRTIDNLIGYDNGATFLLLDVFDSPDNVQRLDILDNVTTGDGRAYGTELAVHYRTSTLTVNLAYTLARVDHRLWNVNDFAYFPANQDRRHDLNLNGSWRFHPRLTLGFAWMYGSGVPTTLPIGIFNSPTLPGSTNSLNQLNIYAGRNGYRMPAVHRLDLSLRWRRSPRWGEAFWEIGVYNAYARANPFFLRTGRGGAGGQRTVFQTALFPIVPSVAYSFKF